MLETGDLPNWLYKFKPVLFILLGISAILGIGTYFGGTVLILVGVNIVYMRYIQKKE